LQKTAVATLAHLCADHVANKTAAAGVIPSLLNAALSIDPALQKQAIITLGCLVSLHDQNKCAAASAGAVQMLIQFVKSDDIALQKAAIESLSHLVSSHPETQSACCAHGAVALVSGLLGTCSELSVYEAAVSCISCLCAGHVENQNAACAAGALQSLIKACNTDSVALQHAILWALGDLCIGNRDNCAAAGAAGVVELICWLLSYYEDQRQVEEEKRNLKDAQDRREAAERIEVQQEQEGHEETELNDDGGQFRHPHHIAQLDQEQAAMKCEEEDSLERGQQPQPRQYIVAFEAVRTLHCLIPHEDNVKKARSLLIVPLLQSMKGLYGLHFDIYCSQVLQKVEKVTDHTTKCADT
jgi:hypothetical protein